MFYSRTGLSGLPRVLAILLYLVFVPLLVVLAAPLTAEETGASVGWCRSDPVFLIDGIPADVFVSVPVHDVHRVSGATEIVITTPVGVGVVQLASGVGFGYGEVVTILQSPSLESTPDGIEVLIEAYVPAKADTVPVLLEVAPRVTGVLAPASAEGTSNQRIVLFALL